MIGILYDGMILKNIREVCEIVKIEYSGSGNCMRIILKEFDRYCKYHKEGHKFIIDEVYNPIKPKQEDRRKYTSGNNAGYRKDYDGYILSETEDKLKGVYAIAIDNNVYIGSTHTTFRKRFSSHKGGKGKQQHTKDILDDGGLFQILWVSDVDDEYLIRQVEQEYIDYFIANKDWKLVNRREETVCLSEKTKYKNKKIFVDERQYDLALEILRNNGIMIGGEDNE